MKMGFRPPQSGELWSYPFVDSRNSRDELGWKGSIMTWNSRVSAAVVVVSSLLVAATVSGSSHAVDGEPAQCLAAQAAPTKILIYGDSLTQSFGGDWTWRYRLWQSL